MEETRGGLKRRGEYSRIWENVYQKSDVYNYGG